MNSSVANGALKTVSVVLLVFWVVAASANPSGLAYRPENPSCLAPPRPPSTLDVTWQPVFENLSFKNLDPLSMLQPPNDPSRWIIAGRIGEVYSFANDDAVSTKQLILDISDRMQFTSTDLTVDSQQYGITSVAFHPQFPEQPYLYVAYNAKPGIDEPLLSVVSRFSSVDGGQTFDSFSEQILVSITQEKPWHHVGQLMFGPDGYLYIGQGDGGAWWDAHAQDLNDLRGSILRVDVNQGSPYSIPPDNPLVGTGFREEIYAWGFKNPWRFTFDRETGELWAGDVGAVLWEEVDRIDAGGNYGWPIMEGNQCYEATECDSTGLIPPVIEIEHPTARAIIGGYVYRGAEVPALQGTYLFGDAVGPVVRGLFFDQQGQPTWDIVAETLDSTSHFAESLDGEIYFFRFKTPLIYKLVVGASPPESDFPELLSETGCVDPTNPASPAGGLIPYTVNTPLWSDGAEKDRWMALPDGQTIDVSPDGDFGFPIGTVLMKNFSFDEVPVETRLFVRHDDGGWAGYSYEWNDDLTDAVLLATGKSKQITPEIVWTFPSRNECLQCHTDAAGFSLGPEIAQLNGSFTYPSTLIEANQLSTLDHIGLFTDGLQAQPSDMPALVAPSAPGTPIGRQARSYLHSNCSGCHRPEGPVQSSVDFRFSTPVEAMNICNVTPAAGDLGIPGAKILVPGDPWNSIISARMHALDTNRMPPLGTSIIDIVGTELMDAWILQPDVCLVYQDTDADLVRDNVDNCTEVHNSDQRDTDGDGIGNLCDADLDNDCMVNFLDLGQIKSVFFSADSDADMNGDSSVNFIDLELMKSYFLQPPGPSAMGCN